jgi:hypothetical protein
MVKARSGGAATMDAAIAPLLCSVGAWCSRSSRWTGEVGMDGSGGFCLERLGGARGEFFKLKFGNGILNSYLCCINHFTPEYFLISFLLSSLIFLFRFNYSFYLKF